MNYQQQNDFFLILSGTVSELQIVSNQHDFILNSEMDTSGATVAVGVAVQNITGSAVSTLQFSTDAGDSTHLFYCVVDNKVITGYFSIVFFSDGDKVDVVAELQNDGIYYAYAVRRPIDHRLWLYPHCNKGRVAHARSGNKLSINIGLICYLMIIIIAAFMYDGEIIDTVIPLVIGFIICSSISLFTYFYLRAGWSDYNIIAEKIFYTLGYNHPELVDMDKESRQYFKDCIKHGEYTYVKESEQDDQVHIAPWVYRYRKTPKLPSHKS